MVGYATVICTYLKSIQSNEHIPSQMLTLHTFDVVCHLESKPQTRQQREVLLFMFNMNDLMKTLCALTVVLAALKYTLF